LISGAILLLIILLAFYLGPKAVITLSGIVTFLLYAEILKAMGGYKDNKFILLSPLICMASAFFVTNYQIILFLFVLIVVAGLFSKNLRWLRLLAFFYVFVAQYLFLTIICEIPLFLNIHQPLFLLMVVVTSDTGGYIFGKLFGKNKLAPKISPKKTWEGAIGSFVMSLFGWFLLFKGFANNLILEAILVIIICACAQIGDLIESHVKRRLSIKDSSRIIPGHGGVFDRIDSILGATFGYSMVISFGFGI
jgi:phosphatidate cytidylyltransferase